MSEESSIARTALRIGELHHKLGYPDAESGLIDTEIRFRRLKCYQKVREELEREYEKVLLSQ